MKQNTNKIITAVLAVALLLAVAVLIYVYLPRSQENQTPGPTPGQTNNTILTVIYGGYTRNYTLQDIEAFPSFTGSGGYIKTKTLPSVSTTGPFNYTGVNVSYLVDQIPNLPSPHSIRVTSSDNYSVLYNWSQIQGDVPIYNGTGNITGSSGMTMLLAYKEQGNLINDTNGGPLRVVYVDNEGFTPSGLWAKLVRTITVITE
jgi:hypothetical protein